MFSHHQYRPILCKYVVNSTVKLIQMQRNPYLGDEMFNLIIEKQKKDDIFYKEKDRYIHAETGFSLESHLKLMNIENYKIEQLN